LIRLEGRKLTRLAAKFAALGALGVFAEGRPDQGEEDARAWVSGDGQGAQRRIVLDEILADLPVASFDAAAARAYAQVRQADPQRNRNALDKLIAAHALSLGVVLVTNNVADFQRVPGLTVENWVMG
jgi:tRNA(fMet)-specific endonuclease VapC